MPVQIQVCPECGNELPSDAATRGLCPRCLIRRALAGIEETAAFGPGADESTPAARFAAPSVSELAEVFEAFEILELLGQGGMGAVYMARQKSLQRLIALKVIPRQLAADPAFVERFHREARTLARLNHPNIVTAYDFGQVDDHCFLVMEYVGGANLRRWLGTGRVRPADAIGVAVQVCDALDYAHGQGVVHRDIKPENILLEEAAGGLAVGGARIKIADFGLVRILEPSERDFTLTTAGHVLGTPQYMAPEQIECPQRVDHRVDIYSLGVVLYEMLTGELPLGRFAPPSERIDWAFGQQPPGGDGPTELPAGAAAWCARLDALVLKCLDKDPQRRPPDAAGLRGELEALQPWFADPAAVAAAPEPVPPRPARRWSPVSVATLLLVLVVVVDLGWQIGERLWGHPSAATAPEPAAEPGVSGPVEKPAKEPAETSVPEGQSAAGSRSPASYRTTIKSEGHRAPFSTIRLTGGSLKGGAGQYSMKIELEGSMFVARPGADYYWVIESDSGWSDEKRVGWDSLRDTGMLRRTFSPPAEDRGPWESWLEMESIGPGTARQRVSSVIRFEEEASNGEE